MAHQEKRSWIMLVVTVIAYGWYVLTVTGRSGVGGLPQVSYSGVLLASVGGAIVASIVAEIGLGVVAPGASRERDVRDRQIGRLGEYIGQSFVIAGAIAAMLMAMAGWDRFWIANVIYLGFVLSAVLGSIAKLAMYRGSFPQW